ncbi:MAG: hypothetical protein ACRDP6_37030, partial [Actinoallomurus sp.]
MAPPTNTPGQNSGPNDWWFLQPSDYNAPSEKWNGSFDDMEKLIDNMSTTHLDTADASYKEAYKLLNDSIEAIATAGYKLSQVWHGDAANNMQESLKRLHATCYNLASGAGMLQNNLFYNTSQDVTWGKANKPKKQTPSGVESFGAGAADVVSDVSAPIVHVFTGWSNNSDAVNKQFDDANNKSAREFLNIDGGQLGHSVFGNYVAVPDKIHTDLPNPDPGKTSPTKKVGPIGPGGTPPMPGGPGSGNVPHPSTNVPHPNLPTHTTPPTPPHTTPIPTGHHPGGADLAGLPTGPGGGGGGLGGGLGGPGGGLGGGLGGGGLGGGPGGGMPGGALGSVGQAAEEAAAARNAALAGKGGANGTGMP